MDKSAQKPLKDWLQKELSGQRLVLSLLSGGLSGLTEVFFTISFASLIFSGPLAQNLPVGIGAALFSAAVIIFVSSLLTSRPGMIASVQDSPAVILAVIAIQLVSGFKTPQDALATVLIGIAIATLLSGLVMLAMGFFGLGGLVRYIPYPVVGGFLAGTGLLLAQGSIGVMADYDLTWQNLNALLQPRQLALWLPGVFCALALFFGLRYIKHWLAMPGLLLGLVAAFYLGLFISGTSLTEARQMGLLMGGMGEIRWQPPTPSVIADVEWGLLFKHSGNMAGLLVISLVSLLLNATGLEVVMGKDADLDQELRATGLANTLSGLGGGFVGYHAVSLSSLNLRIGGKGRLPGLITGIVPALTLFAGTSLLAYFPVPLVGGFLLMLGLDFLDEWVFRGWRQYTRVEYAAALLIMAAIFFTDFLFGVGLGLAITIVIFVLRYSQIKVVQYVLDGSQMQSNIERPVNQRHTLIENGKSILILKLSGFIFFGTSNNMLEQVRARVTGPDAPPVRYLLLDFQRVSGLDSSAVLSFAKICQLSNERGMEMVTTGAKEEVKKRLDDSLTRLATCPVSFPDLDRGLEWCEEQLLLALGHARESQPDGLLDQLQQNGLPNRLAKRLMHYLEHLSLEAGEYIIHQGEVADEMFYIVNGRVSVYLENPDGSSNRLRTLTGGSTVGEMGLYLNQPRTASVKADEPSVAYRLSRSALYQLEHEDPELAAAFHAMMARLLSEMMTIAARALEAVLR